MEHHDKTTSDAAVPILMYRTGIIKSQLFYLQDALISESTRSLFAARFGHS